MTMPLATTPHISTYAARNTSLDLIKWLAIITMLLDHLRLVWPVLGDLFIIGRWAFPLFCLAIAANVVRHDPATGVWTPRNLRYIGSLMLFALISEYPYHLLSPDSPTLNILPTLAAGLLICWGVHYRTILSISIATCTFIAAYVGHAHLMYGGLGALLPLACWLGIRYGRPMWVMPALLATLTNLPHELINTGIWSWQHALVLGSAAIAPIVGLWLLQQSLNQRIHPVGRWGYWFYPVHLLVLYVISLGVQHTTDITQPLLRELPTAQYTLQ
ncbi:MAG: TraX family protein [Pseudomonadota bacterium]|nr:TraX family protein [Pseudomonadota bacterium]